METARAKAGVREAASVSVVARMSAMLRSRRPSPLWHALALAAIVALVPPASADEATARLLHLIVDGDTLIASNIHFNRFDELKLQAKERVVEKAVANAVAVVVTNQRILAYSVYTSAWQPLRRQAGERIEQVSAEDFGATLTSTQRLLNFNGRNGVWAEKRR